jgi:hypothetical protein
MVSFYFNKALPLYLIKITLAIAQRGLILAAKNNPVYGILTP